MDTPFLVHIAEEPKASNLLAALTRPWLEPSRTQLLNNDEHADHFFQHSVDVYCSSSMGTPKNVWLGPLTVTNLNIRGSELATAITSALLERHSGTHFMLHAGGVAFPDGRVVGVVGPSGRGKTTTTAQLARSLGYVTDEALFVGPDGAVTAYPKPLSVITANDAAKKQIPAITLGLKPIPQAPLQLSALLLLVRADKHDAAPFISKGSLAWGIAALAEHTSYLASLDTPLQTMARIAVEAGGIYQLHVGDPARLDEIINDLDVLAVLGPHHHKPDDALPRNPHRRSDEPWQEALPYTGWLPHAALQPATVLDAIETPEHTVVFTADQRVHVLQGLGPLLWRAACEQDSWDELYERVRTTAGEPEEGDVAAMLHQLIYELQNAGILVAKEPDQ